MAFIVTILVLISISIIIYFLKLKIVIEYNREGVNDHFVLSYYLLKGLIKYKYEIPKIDAGKKGFRFKRVKEKGKKEKDVSKEQGKFSYEGIKNKIDRLRLLYRENEILIGKVRKYIKCRLKVKKLDMNIFIGTGNAHHTAVLTGLCWSAAGLILSLLHNSLNITEKCINIKPDYMGKKLKVDLFCILSVRLGHIIIVGLIALKHTIKVKFGFVDVKRGLTG